MVRDKFLVVPLCRNQLRDIHPEDVLNGGLYRKCKTYKAGGGYDQFPEIWKNRIGTDVPNIGEQFVVQLYGCPLSCDYCYVTPSGVWGNHVGVSAEKLVEDFKASGCGSFHLMGGAPAIYLEYWEEILELLDPSVPFHSDFVLCEKPRHYDVEVLNRLEKYKNGLYAVSIKGLPEWYSNQGIDWHIICDHLAALKQSNLNYYFTFTGMKKSEVEWWKRIFPYYNYEGSFTIDLKRYNALS